MPTYHYQCRACGQDLEVQQSFTDDALTECPECGGALRKVFGAVGVVFKGSGFYRTDSRASSESSGDAGSTSTEKKSDSIGSGASSDSNGSGGSSEKAAPSGGKEKAGTSGTSSGSGSAA